MERLLDDFETLCDLDYEIQGVRLATLIEQALANLEDSGLPEFGTPGPAHEKVSIQDGLVNIYYAPHLFPGMDLKLRLAHQLQFHMLPRELPNASPVSISAVLESYCHLSGDLFGWEQLSEGDFLLWIMDVSGHGVRSGLASAVLQVIINNLRLRNRVYALVEQLNHALNGCVRKDHGVLFATGFFVVFHQDGTATYTSAGHPPILLVQDQGRVSDLNSNSAPIGLFPDARFRAEKRTLTKGEMLLLYTDGVVELSGVSEEEFGLKRLRNFLSHGYSDPSELTAALYETIGSHQDLSKLDDDVTFVAARFESPRPPVEEHR